MEMEIIINGAIFAATLISKALAFGATVTLVLYFVGAFPGLKAETDNKKRIARAITLTLAFTMMLLGSFKIIQTDTMILLWDKTFHMAYMMTTFGIMEISMGILLLFPQVFKLGVLLLTVSLGGSMSIHFPTFSDGPGAMVASIIMLVLLWTSAVLQAPEMFPKFISKCFHPNES